MTANLNACLTEADAGFIQQNRMVGRPCAAREMAVPLKYQSFLGSRHSHINQSLRRENRVVYHLGQEAVIDLAGGKARNEGDSCVIEYIVEVIELLVFDPQFGKPWLHVGVPPANKNSRPFPSL